MAAVVVPTGPEVDRQRQELRMVFRVFDKNAHGRLAKADVAAAMRALGKRALPAKIDAFMKTADKDGDGFVDADEFVDYMIRKRYAKAAKEGTKKAKKPAASPKKAKPAAARKGRGKRAKADDAEEAVEEKKAEPAAAAVVAVSAEAPVAAPVRARSIVEFYTPFAGCVQKLRTCLCLIPTACTRPPARPPWTSTRTLRAESA